MQPSFQFEGKSSVSNKILWNGKYSRAGEHIGVLSFTSGRKMWQVAGKVSDPVIYGGWQGFILDGIIR